MSSNTKHRLLSTGTLQTVTSLDEITNNNIISFGANVIIGQLDEITGLTNKAMSFREEGQILLANTFDEITDFNNQVILVPMISTANDIIAQFNGVAQVGTSAQSMVLFNDTGSIMYFNSNLTKTLYQYTLSIPWDITTAVYDNKSLYHGTQTTGGSYNAYGGSFKPDGTSVFIQYMGLNDVFEYTMTTAWDLSTATYSGNSYSMAQNYSAGFDFATDGLSMYVVDPIDDGLFQYKLSTAWDITSASFYVKYTPPSGGSDNPEGIRWFNAYNFYLYRYNGKIYQYKTSVAWDCSSEYVTFVGGPGGRTLTNPEFYFNTGDPSVVYIPQSNSVYTYAVTPGTP